MFVMSINSEHTPKSTINIRGDTAQWAFWLHLLNITVVAIKWLSAPHRTANIFSTYFYLYFVMWNFYFKYSRWRNKCRLRVIKCSKICWTFHEVKYPLVNQRELCVWSTTFSHLKMFELSFNFFVSLLIHVLHMEEVV